MIGKGEIRRRILDLRNAMTTAEIGAGSDAIVKGLTELGRIRRASSLKQGCSLIFIRHLLRCLNPTESQINTSGGSAPKPPPGDHGSPRSPR